MDPNELLLKLLKERGAKNTEFNRGILTADRYVKTVESCVGLDACYKFASKSNVSFSDVLKKASETLTYSNDEMVVEDKGKDIISQDGLSIELPKNTLMVIKHVLTTSTKDRDGDILRTDGAVLDPKMLLLWQHIHTLPIGKMLGVASHTSKSLSLYSAIVDINDVAKDAAVMVDNDMGRFSHGFSALEFSQLKDEDEYGMAGGFDIKKYAIIEESVVSVPANADAVVEEVLLSLVEGGKLTSGIMKSVGQGIRDRRDKTFVVPETLVLAKENKDDEKAKSESKTETGSKGCSCGGSSPKETNAVETKINDTKNQEVTEEKDLVISEKGFYSSAIDGSYEAIRDDLNSQVKGYLDENDIDMDDYCYCHVVGTFQKNVIIMYEEYDDGYKENFIRVGWKYKDGSPKLTGTPTEVNVSTTTKIEDKSLFQHLKKLAEARKQAESNGVEAAMKTILAYADRGQRSKLLDSLKAFQEIDERTERTKKFKELMN